MRSVTFLFERNSFKVYKLSILGDSCFVAERTEDDSVGRHIRKSLPVLEKIIDAE